MRPVLAWVVSAGVLTALLALAAVVGAGPGLVLIATGLLLYAAGEPVERAPESPLPCG